MNHSLPSMGNKLALTPLAGAIFLASLGISMATVALPTLARTFAAGVQLVQWVVLAYLLAVTATIVVAGRLGDWLGSRRMLVAGVTLFTLASVACAVAGSLSWLIAARVAQGLGAAILLSLPMSMAKRAVPQARMGTAMGLLGTMSAIGTALGPSLGGVLIGSWGWRAAFMALALCGAALLSLTLLCLSAEKAPRATSVGMDWAGSVWLSVMLLCFALCATGDRVGLGLPPAVLGALGCAALVMLVRTEMASAQPLVPVALLKGRATATALVMNLLVGAIMMSTLVVGPFYLSFGLGLSEAETGLVMAMGPLAAALAGVPAGRLTDRFGPHRTLLSGLVLATTGLCAFALLPGQLGKAGYVAALMLMTPGFQLFLAANSTELMAGAADAHKGLLSGLLGLSRNMGFMTGASVLPWLFAWMLDGQGPLDSAPQTIGRAFSLTFLVAALLCGAAIALALWQHRARSVTSVSGCGV